MLKKFIGILLVVMTAMTQVCVFADGAAGGYDPVGGGINIGYSVQYNASKSYTNDVADVEVKVSDQYPVNGQKVYVLTQITAKQDIAPQTLKLTYGNISENISAEAVPAGETVTYATSIDYNDEVSHLNIENDGVSLISGGFVFKKEIKMVFADISVTQVGANEGAYEFEVSAAAENIGNIDIRDYGIKVMKGEEVLYSQDVSKTEAKSKSELFTEILIFNKADFEDNKCSLDFEMVYERKTIAEESADAVVTTILSLENLKSEITQDKGESGFGAKISGEVKNSGALDSGEVKVNILSGESVLGTVTLEKVDGFRNKNFSGDITLPKSAFNAEKTATLTVEIEGADVSLPCEVKYSTDIETVFINGAGSVSIAQGRTLSVAVSYAPVTAQPVSQPVISIENTEIATFADGVVTAVSEGETNICVEIDTDVFKVPLTVTRALAEGEIADIKVYTVDVEGNKTYRQLYNNTKKTEGFVYSDTSYGVQLDGTEKSAGFEFVLANGQVVNVTQRSDSSSSESTVGDYANISLPTRKNRISVKVNGTSGVVYVITFNRLPELTDDLPETFYAFTNLETNTKLNNYFDDYEDEKKVSKIELKDSDGKALGTCTYDSEDGWRWKYTTSETAKTMDITITVTDKNDGAVEKNLTLVCGKDTEKPSFGNGYVVSTSGATSSSVNVSWGRASDNDMVKEYVINYSKSPTMSNVKTVTVGAGDDIDRKKTITGLNSGTKYYVTVTAYDRSGNYVESESDYFTTSSGGSNSLGSGGLGNLGSLGNVGGMVNLPSSGAAGTQTDKFTDIGNYAWAKDAINVLAGKGVVNGVGENKFAPASNIKRADFALMVVRAFGFDGANGVGFSDVYAEDYYADAVKTAQALGIVNGIGDGKFGPQEFVTRQDMAVMLQRALAKKNISLGTNSSLNFTDADKISNYAKYAIGILANSGIITGDENKNVNPLGNATRAELAVMIYRALVGAKLI